MKKRMIALALALAFVLTLALLNKTVIEPGLTEPSTTGTAGTTQSLNIDSTQPTEILEEYPYSNLTAFDKEAENYPEIPHTITIQHVPEVVDNPRDVPVLKWVYINHISSERVWSEDAVIELNKMLNERNMPFLVQFVMLTWQREKVVIGYYNTNVDLLKSPEAQELLKDADLIYGAMDYNERMTYFSPITEHVKGNAQPSLKNAMPHEKNWIGTSFNGEIYGIPTGLQYPRCNGWSVNADFMKEFGLTVEDFSGNFWEMDEVFAKIYSQNGGNPFLYIDPNFGGAGEVPGPGYSDIKSVSPGEVTFMTSCAFQYIGICFGVDFHADTPVVVNTFDTELYRNFSSAIIRYTAAGYTTQKLADDSMAMNTAKVHYTNLVGNRVYANSVNGDICIPITKTVQFYSDRKESFSGVAAVSQHKEEALSLLNLMAEDELFRKQLFFGKEGRDYTVANGQMTVVKQSDGSQYDMRFLSALSEFTEPLDTICEPYDPQYEGETKLQTYLNCMDNVDVICYPVHFDYTGLEEKVDAIIPLVDKFSVIFTNAEDRYYPRLGGGTYFLPKLDEEMYDQLMQEIMDAGGRKIQTELQRQLDEWLANNPDWQ